MEFPGKWLSAFLKERLRSTSSLQNAVRHTPFTVETSVRSFVLRSVLRSSSGVSKKSSHYPRNKSSAIHLCSSVTVSGFP